jgi:hypothetical protein
MDLTELRFRSRINKHNVLKAQAADAGLKAQRQRLGEGCVSAFNGVANVRPREGGEQWRSSIAVNGTTHYLGCFKDEREAALAFDAKCKTFPKKVGASAQRFRARIATRLTTKLCVPLPAAPHQTARGHCSAPT